MPPGRVSAPRHRTDRLGPTPPRPRRPQVAKLQAEAERLISEARAAAQKQVAEAKAVVSAECAKELAEAKAKVDAELSRALAALESEKEAAMKGLDAQVGAGRGAGHGHRWRQGAGAADAAALHARHGGVAGGGGPPGTARPGMAAVAGAHAAVLAGLPTTHPPSPVPAPPNGSLPQVEKLSANILGRVLPEGVRV